MTNLPAINYAWGTLTSFPGDSVAWICEQGRARGGFTSGLSGDTRTSSSLPARCFASGNGGKTWSQHDVPESGTSTFGRRRYDSTVNVVAAVDGSRAWIVVGTLDTFAGGGHESITETDVRLLTTASAGATWTLALEWKQPEDSPSPPPENQWVSIGPSGAVYASGLASGIEESLDGGRTWTLLDVPLPSIAPQDESRYCSVDEHGSSLIVTIAQGGNDQRRLLRVLSTDRGRTWSTIATPPTATPTGAPGLAGC